MLSSRLSLSSRAHARDPLYPKRLAHRVPRPIKRRPRNDRWGCHADCPFVIPSAREGSAVPEALGTSRFLGRWNVVLGMTEKRLRCEERLDQTRDGLGLIVMQHVPGVCDELEPAVANVREPATNDVESVAVAIAVRATRKPAQNVRVGGGDPQRR